MAKHAHSTICWEADVCCRQLDHEHRTALHSAIWEGVSVSIIQKLLAQKFDINARCRDTQTPLHYAVMCASLDICEYLLSHGAGVNAINPYDVPVLNCVVSNDTPAKCELLFAYGANTNMLGSFDYTPLDRALIHDNYAVSSYLFEQGMSRVVFKCSSPSWMKIGPLTVAWGGAIETVIAPDMLDSYLTASRNAAFSRRKQAISWWFTRCVK
jgi:ankyrin repeat protein